MPARLQPQLAAAAQLRRHLEGELLDHDGLQLIAGQVESLPELARAEQHGAALAEALDQRARVVGGAARREHLDAVVAQPLGEQRRDVVHAAQAREEAERATAEPARQRLEHVHGLAHQIGATSECRDAHVLLVRERARHRQRARRARRSPTTPSLAERRERVAADEEARRDARERLEPVEEVLAEGLGRRDQPHREPPAIPRRVDALERGDRVFRSLEREAQRARRAAQLRGVARDAARALLEIDRRLDLARRLRRCATRRSPRSARRPRIAARACAGTCTSPNSLANGSSERPSATSSCCTPRRQASASLRSRATLRRGQHPSRVARRSRAARIMRWTAEDVVDALEHLVGTHRERVDLVRDVGQLVRLVHDRVGEGRIVGRPAQQQVVVRDDEVRLRQRRAAAAERAVRVRRALFARALLGARCDRAAQQIEQRRVASQPRRGHRAELAVRADRRARREHGVGVALLRERAAPRAPRPAPRRGDARTRSSRGP